MAHFLPRFHKTVLFFVSYRTFIILGQDLGHLGHCLYLALPCFLPSSFTIFCYYCFFSFQKKGIYKKNINLKNNCKTIILIKGKMVFLINYISCYLSTYLLSSLICHWTESNFFRCSSYYARRTRAGYSV